MFFVGAAKTFPQITRGARWRKFRHHINIMIHPEDHTLPLSTSMLLIYSARPPIFLCYIFRWFGLYIGKLLHASTLCQSTQQGLQTLLKMRCTLRICPIYYNFGPKRACTMVQEAVQSLQPFEDVLSLSLPLPISKATICRF
jgi:hypothetical protein